MNTTGNRVILRITFDQFSKLLGLPDDMVIIATNPPVDTERQEHMDIKVYHPDLPAVLEGANIPIVHAVLRHEMTTTISWPKRIKETA